MRTTIAVLSLLAACAAGCGPRTAPAARVPLTERERDSVLARSSLPGAPVVGRALDAGDRAAERAAGVAAADSLFR